MPGAPKDRKYINFTSTIIPQVFPVAIPKPLLGYAFCQFKSWNISDLFKLQQKCLGYKAVIARERPALWCGERNREEPAAVEQFGDWTGNMEPMKCTPKTSHPCTLQLCGLPPPSLCQAGTAMGTLQVRSYLHSHSSLLPLQASLHLLLIPPCFPATKWVYPVIPVCDYYIFFPSFWN